VKRVGFKKGVRRNCRGVFGGLRGGRGKGK